MKRTSARLAATVWFWILATGSLADVVINEIQYNTPGGTDVEFVELTNTGPSAVNLAGWYLLDDDDANPPCLLEGTLQPGAYRVAVGDFALFANVYAGVPDVNPNPFGGGTAGGFGLGNSADTVRLFDASGQLVDSVAYSDGGAWPIEADGNGPSLELRNPLLPNDNPASWAASVNLSPPGTPGAVNSVFVANPPPLIADVTRSVPLPGSADTVSVTAIVTDTGPFDVTLWVDRGQGFSPQPMADDGLSSDGAAGDSVFGASIAPAADGSLVRYYVEAEDDEPQSTTAPTGAPAEFLAYTVGHVPPGLRIHELLASNQSVNIDEAEETDDWIELYNPGPGTVDLQGMFLSGDLRDSTRWRIPELVLGPGEFVLIWCDDDENQGPRHTDFTLPREGGEVGLFGTVEHGNTLVHGVTFGPQNPDVSFGTLGGGDHPEYLASPTPASDNEISVPYSDVCINELLTASQLPGVDDWIELFNRGETSVDIAGWSLSDASADPTRYTFGPGTILPPGGRLSLDASALGFGLDAGGDEVVVLTSDGGTTGRDYVDYGPQLTDVSYGRYPEGTANWHLLSPSTRDIENRCAAGSGGIGDVQDLRFEGPRTLAWNPAVGATAYDVVVGDLTLLRASHGAFEAAVTACSENDGPDSLSWTDEPGGTPSRAFFLVRGVNDACGFGGWGTGGNGQTAPRDPGSAAGSCP